MRINYVSVRLLVVILLLINVLALPSLTGKALAADAEAAAAAGSAGKEAGLSTLSGVQAGTIAAGAAVAALVTMAIVSSGGTGDAVAVAPLTPTESLQTLDPATKEAVLAALQALGVNETQALNTALQGNTPAQNATLLNDAKTLSLGDFVAKYPSFMQSLTPAQRTLVKNMLASITDPTVLTKVSDAIKTFATGTDQEIAENLAKALQTMLTAKHVGYTVTVTAFHQGNNVWTTVTHIK